MAITSAKLNKLLLKKIKIALKTRTKILIILILAILLTGLSGLFTKSAPIRYIDRQDGKIKTEQVVAGQALNWLYSNPLGELSLWAVVKRKFVSEFYGQLMNTKWSARKVDPFVRKYHINLKECRRHNFSSFNDFFTRRLKPGARKIDTNQNAVISPGDGKILAYADVSGQDFIVKGYRFQLKNFLQNDSLAVIYKHSSMFLLRLCPTDYHRFHFPVNGIVSKTVKVKGDYYSVSPLAIKQRIKIFCENKRDYNLIATQKFGNVLMSEIGATMVGSIIQTFRGHLVVKGAEKGYFKFGGSSIILLFQKGTIKIDDDLLENTQNHLETQVKMGEHIALLAN